MLAWTVTFAGVQEAVAGGVNVTEPPVAVFPGGPVAPDKAPQPEPPSDQFSVADPLKSFTSEAESMSGDPCASTAGVVLSPAPSTIETGLTANLRLSELEAWVTEVAVGVALQFEVSDDSAGGV